MSKGNNLTVAEKTTVNALITAYLVMNENNPHKVCEERKKELIKIKDKLKDQIANNVL